MGLFTDRINNKLEKSDLINEHAPNREPVPLRLLSSWSLSNNRFYRHVIDLIIIGSFYYRFQANFVNYELFV